MKLLKKYSSINLLLRIVIGFGLGILIGALVNITGSLSGEFWHGQAYMGFLGGCDTIFKIFGNLFIGALRGVAPVLVFFLVSSALMSNKKHNSLTLRRQMALYVLATFIAAFVAVMIN